MKKLLLIGPPGAGKGTQADLICSSLNIPKISTGDMLRAAIASGNELGQKVSSVMKSGSLVSDEIIIELISDRISQPDCGSGFLFDGCIRTAGQADLCVQNNIEFTHVIEINVVDEILLIECLVEEYILVQVEITILFINHLDMMGLMTKPVSP